MNLMNLMKQKKNKEEEEEKSRVRVNGNNIITSINYYSEL